MSDHEDDESHEISIHESKEPSVYNGGDIEEQSSDSSDDSSRESKQNEHLPGGIVEALERVKSPHISSSISDSFLISITRNLNYVIPLEFQEDCELAQLDEVTTLYQTGHSRIMYNTLFGLLRNWGTKPGVKMLTGNPIIIPDDMRVVGHYTLPVVI
jgi:hypothetical protein